MITKKIFAFNPFGVNCYVLFDETSEAVIVDASCYTEAEENTLKNFIAENRLNPVKLITTHGHVDHLLGINFVLNTYNIPFYLHPSDIDLVKNATQQGQMFGFKVKEVPLPTNELTDNELLNFGNSTLEVRHIPGHSLGSVVFISHEDKLILSGDVLFAGSIGRTDLPDGDYNTLVSGIKGKLLSLPGEYEVYPGHGSYTMISLEKYNNPFLQ